jgi:hypothetical protein
VSRAGRRAEPPNSELQPSEKPQIPNAKSRRAAVPFAQQSANLGVPLKVGRIELMRERTKWLGGAAGVVLVCAAAHASEPDRLAHPYELIALRNVFALVAGPKPLVVDPVRPPLPKVILTGIASVLGHKLALLKVQFSAKPGEPAREVNLLLTEGQRESGIEVVRIEEKPGRVELNNSGILTTLTFSEDGVK